MAQKKNKYITPSSWSAQCKNNINEFCNSIKLKRPFVITIYDLFASPPNWQKNIEKQWGKIKEGSNLQYGIYLSLFCLLIIFVAGEETKAKERWVEFWGVFYDMVFILVIYEYFRKRLTQKSLIQKYKEVIEDYKCWDSEEAQFRLAGAVRRLNKLGITNIDFSDCKISDFSFKSHQLNSIDGSTFDGTGMSLINTNNNAYLKKVCFSNISCCGVIFSNQRSNLSLFQNMLLIEDCHFSHCNLSGADFSGSKLMWSEVPSKSHYDIDYDPDGEPIYTRVTRSPFDNANLEGVIFNNVIFENVDFRDADNIERASFLNAKGLETCVFDNDEIKTKIIAHANRTNVS